MTTKGTAVIHGFNGTAAVAGSARALNALNPRRTTPKSTLEDGQNNVLSMAYSNPRDTIEIEFAPVATVTAGAVVPLPAATAWIPAPGALVTLADMDMAYQNGTWNFDGEFSQTSGKGQPMVIRLTLTRMGAPDGSGHPTALAAIA